MFGLPILTPQRLASLVAEVSEVEGSKFWGLAIGPHECTATAHESTVKLPENRYLGVRSYAR